MCCEAIAATSSVFQYAHEEQFNGLGELYGSYVNHTACEFEGSFHQVFLTRPLGRLEPSSQP